MKCYECRREGHERDAVVLCNHCLSALCETHLCLVDDPVTTIEPMVKVVSLPLPARRFLCATCRIALRQRAQTAPGDAVADRNTLELAASHGDAPVPSTHSK